MDDLLQCYSQMFTPLARENGFEACGKSFYRVTNDIVQGFMLVVQPYGGICTIEWFALPFCLPVTKEAFASSRRIGNFLGHAYIPGCDESQHRAVDKLFVVTRDVLLPPLDRVVDASSAYAFYCDNDIQRYGGIRMHDYIKAVLSIKVGDYPRAEQHLRAVEAHRLAVFNSNLDMMGKDPDLRTDLEGKEAYIKDFTESIVPLRYMSERLSIPDMDYINDYITSNEEQSRINLGLKQE